MLFLAIGAIFAQDPWEVSGWDGFLVAASDTQAPDITKQNKHIIGYTTWEVGKAKVAQENI